MIRLALCIALFVLADAQFRSPTGRRVSIKDLPNGFPQPIYEFSYGYLLGPNTRIHVESETSQMKASNLGNSVMNIRVNGQWEVTRQRVNSEIRQGHGLTFMFTGERLLAVSGTNINLRPLKGHPGLFINTILPQGSKLKVEVVEEGDPDDDMEPVPETNVTESGSERFFTSTRQTSCASGANLYYEIAVAYDNTFCEEFGGDEAAASAMIQVLVDASNVAYTKNTCITLSLVHIDAHCNDPSDPYDYRPFGSCPGLSSSSLCSNSRSILYSFRAFWNGMRSDVHRDGAFLFTGYNDGTSTTGIAFVRAACGPAAYGWTEGINLKTFAHEIGHTLGSFHRSEDGIMQQGPITNFCFLPDSVAEFTAYIDTTSASCITDDPPKCGLASGGCSTSACSGNQCITGRNVPHPLVPCSPIQGNYYCLSSVGSGRFLAVDCPDDGLTFVRRANDPSDPSILCCAPPRTSTLRRMLKSTVIWPFEPLRVGSGTFLNGVRNNSQITTETLLQTSVVASCIAPSSAPATNTPTPSSMSVSTRTCERTMPATKSFKCAENTMRFKFGKVGTLIIRLSQAFGLFTLTASTNSVSKIRRVAFEVRVESGVVIPLSPVSSVDKKRFISFNPFIVPVSAGRKNCCGMLLKIKITFTIKNKTSKKSASSTESFNYRMECKQVCQKKGGKPVGIVRPFNAVRECPFCKIK